MDEQPPTTDAEQPVGDGPAEEQPDAGETGSGTGGGRRTGLLAAAAAVVVILLGLGAFMLLRGGDEQPAPTSSTTTTESSTTSSTAPSLTATVAQSGVALNVLRDPPPEWATGTPVSDYGPPAPEASQPAQPVRVDLPAEGADIDGRYWEPFGWKFNSPTSFGSPLTFLVTERRGEWLQVLVPVRPNGTVGYVPVKDVTLSEVATRIELRVGERRLRLLRNGAEVFSTEVVVGKPETPTPTGRFFITDKVSQDNPDGVYGPLVLATSAYSEHLDVFDNGVPVIALHGTNQPQLIGQDVSNGCVRMANDVITRLGREVQLGTPVDIYP